MDGVSFGVETGEFFGILGPNGVGKTTLLEIIEGLREPDEGGVTLLGEQVWPRNMGLLPRIGVQLQAMSFFSVLLGLVQMTIFVTVALLPFFGLKLSGSWWMAIPLVIAGVFAFLSLGLLVSAFTKTVDAAQGIVQMIVLPMAFLSGAFFPLDGAPSWLQAVSKVLPLRSLTDALRDVMVRRVGPLSVPPTIGGLLVFAVAVTALAGRFFKWDDA